MEYLKAFLVGGAICMVGQILIDKTKLTPARILVCFVVLGVILGGAGVYEKLVDFAGAGATVPLPQAASPPQWSSAFSPRFCLTRRIRHKPSGKRCIFG